MRSILGSSASRQSDHFAEGESGNVPVYCKMVKRGRRLADEMAQPLQEATVDPFNAGEQDSPFFGSYFFFSKKKK